MNSWVQKLFEFHRNPIKIEHTIVKNYKNVDAEKENHDTEESFKILSSKLEVERVDRRCARLKGIWDPKIQLIIIKRTKGCLLKKIGFKNKSGHYLHPEEALYLLEMNRLEILWKSLTMSIQQAYSVLTDVIGLNSYFIYRKLAANGLNVELLSQTRKRKLKGETSRNKKIKHVTDEAGSLELSSTSETFQKLFTYLKVNGPKDYTIKVEPKENNYNIHMDGCKEEAKVFICKDKKFDPKWGLYEEHSINLFGIIQTDDISFYRFSSLNLTPVD